MIALTALLRRAAGRCNERVDMRTTVTRDDHGVSVRAVESSRQYSPFIWRLVYYAPYTVMKRHRHDVAQFSVLLSGAVREITNNGAVDSTAMLMEFKPANFFHANEFGSDGALLLSINIDPDNENLKDEFRFDEWRIGPGASCQAEWAMLAHKMLSCEAEDAGELELITHDLLAGLAEECDAVERQSAPDWLLRAREAILETEDSIQSIADDAGVHRVHLARSFRRCFGQPISHFRRERRVAKAVRFLTHDNIAPGPASFAAGFSDQSHLTRSLRAAVGLTPAALRSIFAG